MDLPKPVVPAPIALVRDLVNTTDHETGQDDLTTPAGLTAFLREAGLIAPSVRSSRDDLWLARRLRTGLRRALEQNHVGASDPIPDLSTVLRQLPIGLDWTDDGLALRPTVGGVPGALAQIGLAVQQAHAEGTWRRLKICSSDDCEWAYYDASKNRSRNWCEYGCGNKIKTKTYRERRRKAG